MRLLLPLVALLLVGCNSYDDLNWPLENAPDRPTPLGFGRYVTPDPEQNPIDPPERFTGYHTATDFEISAAEEGQTIPVFAICAGRVRFSGKAEGYGGALVHDCTIQGEPVTVLYGHLDPDSLPEADSVVEQGAQIGTLANEYSAESGFTRTHLHLGIHRGSDLDFRGYVPTESELEDYIDPLSVLPKPVFHFESLDLPTKSGADVYPSVDEDHTDSSTSDF